MRVARSRRLVSSGLNEKHTVTGPPLVGGWGLGDTQRGDAVFEMQDLSVNGSHAELRGVWSGGGGGGRGGGGVVKALVPPRWISLSRHSAAAQV